MWEGVSSQDWNDGESSCLRQREQEGILCQIKLDEEAVRKTTSCLSSYRQNGLKLRGYSPWTKGECATLIQSQPLIPGKTGATTWPLEMNTPGAWGNRSIIFRLVPCSAAVCVHVNMSNTYADTHFVAPGNLESHNQLTTCWVLH